MRVAALSSLSLPCDLPRAPLATLHRPQRVDAVTREPTLPLGERLTSIWASQRLAHAHTAELAKAIDTLIDYHVASGFFGKRMDGMQRLDGFGDGSVEVRLAPNRGKVPINHDPNTHQCDLCDPPFPEERGLAWRTWRIWPNAFPYVPANDQHILLTTAAHRSQGFAPSILADMIDFQSAAANGRQLTLHFNGIAGNSQAHLHWQATRVTLPLQRELDAGRLRPEPVLRRASGSVETFARGTYAGFLVSGETAFVARQAARIINRLERDPLTRGAYNLLLLARKAGRARLVIVPRRADNLKPTVGSLGPAGIGAFNVGGVVVVPRAELPDDFAASLEPAMRATVVPPSELGWVAQLAEDDPPLCGPAPLAVAVG